MRRAILLMATMALTLLVASGVALAVTRVGTEGHDTLNGTRGPDQLFGMGGNDIIDGRAGNDVIDGGPGNDGTDTPERALGFLYGGPGADVIMGGPGDDTLQDGPYREGAVDTLMGGDGKDYFITFNEPPARDIVICGAGRDAADVDRKDIVSDDCERIFR